ncbi:MAG: hypothetical protein ACTHMS_23445 [Jatrophihabitans sp.]|uniref:hypothetical protein n=1 Tax=Jatrophihabitans sp. TaxID=1932789 RepID=UPI003F8100CE
MTVTIPRWLRADDVDVDRVLIAAWLLDSGEQEAAVGIAASAVAMQGHRVDRQVIEVKLRGVAEHLADYVECEADPRTWGKVVCEIDGDGDWRAWGEAHCEQILADAVVDAEAILLLGRRLSVVA